MSGPHFFGLHLAPMSSGDFILEKFGATRVMRRARVLPFPALLLVHHDVRSWRSFDTAWSAISAYHARDSGYGLIDELCVMTHLPVVYY